MSRVIKDEDIRWGRFADHRRVRVVGEAYHQAPLEQISGNRVVGSTRLECTAVLCREPDNAEDPWAVEVRVDGLRIGYLSRGSARRLNRRLRKLEEEGERTTCPALIREADNGVLQGHLQIPYGSRLLSGWENPKRHARPPKD